MSYVFGATLALAGLERRRAANYSPSHPRECQVCRMITDTQFTVWLQGALAVQREEIHALWDTPMPIPHGSAIIKRHAELGCS